jgi:excisionase family DNA binding protein
MSAASKPERLSIEQAAEEGWIRPGEAAHRLNLSYTRIIQLIDDGKLTVRRTALGRLVDPVSVEKLLEERSR